MFKKLGFAFLSAVALSGCGPDVPEDLQKAGTKEFWTEQAKQAATDTSAVNGFRDEFCRRLNRGVLVVLEQKEDPMTVMAIDSKVLRAAIVTPAKDTIAEVYYLNEFMIFNAEHKQQSGEESLSRCFTRMTLRDDKQSSTQSVMREESSTFKTNNDIVRKQSVYF